MSISGHISAVMMMTLNNFEETYCNFTFKCVYVSIHQWIEQRCEVLIWSYFHAPLVVDS